MKINDNLFKEISETAYLSTENTWRYRPILRFFYFEYEKMNISLYRDDIYAELSQHSQFSEYTPEMLNQDLDALVRYKNLTAVQDTTRVQTTEEFKNRRFKYSLSPYAVEIERLAIRLENLAVENSSLDPSLLEKLKKHLQEINSIIHHDPNVIGVWWSELINIFESLNQKYQDYIRDFYSPKAEEIMKSDEFIVFKDRFVEYLRDFIKGLQFNSQVIEGILRKCSKIDINLILNKVFQYYIAQRALNITKLDMPQDDEMIKDNIEGRWNSLKNWFIDTPVRKSDSERLMDITNDIILKITRYAYLMSENRRSSISRKDEYRHLIEMFYSCTSLEEAHKLSAHCFGVINSRHVLADMERKTESTSSGIFDEAPLVLSLRPRTRNFRERHQRNATPDNSQKKKESLSRLIAERRAEQELVESYIIDNKIVFKDLPDLSIKVRRILLEWLSKGRSIKGQVSRTEYGKIYSVKEPENGEECVLHCEDGDFTMPAFILEFKGGE